MDSNISSMYRQGNPEPPPLRTPPVPPPFTGTLTLLLIHNDYPSIKLPVNTGTKICAIKNEYIQGVSICEGKQVDLVYRGTVLRDSNTLEQCGIEENCKVIVRVNN